MSTDNTVAQKPAKAIAFENFVAKLKHEAGKEVVSEQQINQAIDQAVLLWLPVQDEKTLTEFFAGIEIAGGAVLARKIERHPQRPTAVAPIVEAARRKAEAQKQAQKAEADRAKEDKERQKLAELKAKYETQATTKAPKLPTDQRPSQIHAPSCPDPSALPLGRAFYIDGVICHTSSRLAAAALESRP